MGRKNRIHERIVIKREDLPKQRNPYARPTQIQNPKRTYRYAAEGDEIEEGLEEWEAYCLDGGRFSEDESRNQDR